MWDVTKVGSSSGSTSGSKPQDQKLDRNSLVGRIAFFETVVSPTKPISRKNSERAAPDPFPSPRIAIPVSQPNSPRGYQSSSRRRASSPCISPSSPKVKRIEAFPLIAKYFKEGEDLNDKLNEIFDVLSQKKDDGSLVREDPNQLLQRDKNEGYFYWENDKAHQSKESHLHVIMVILNLISVALDFGKCQFMRHGESDPIEVNSIVIKLLENESAREMIHANIRWKRMAFKILVKSVQGTEINRRVNELLKFFNPETNIWEALALIFYALGEDQNELQKPLLKRKVDVTEIDQLFEKLGLSISSNEQDKQTVFRRLKDHPWKIFGADGYATDDYSLFFKKTYENRLLGYTKNYLALIEKPMNYAILIENPILTEKSQNLEKNLEKIEELKKLYDKCELNEFIRKFMRPANNAIKSLIEGLPVVFSSILKRATLFLERKNLSDELLKEKLQRLPSLLKQPIQWEEVGNTVRFIAAKIANYYLDNPEIAHKLCYPFLNGKPCKSDHVFQLPTMRLSLNNLKADSPPLSHDNRLSCT